MVSLEDFTWELGFSLFFEKCILQWGYKWSLDFLGCNAGIPDDTGCRTIFYGFLSTEHRIGGKNDFRNQEWNGGSLMLGMGG